MKVIDHINNAKKTLFSVEVIPPVKGYGIDSLYDSIDKLIEFEPAFINVTYHREEFVYKKRENGLLEKVSITKRPGTVGICASIMNKYKIDTVPHLICGGFSKAETENALIDLQFLGIDNVFALRGDPIKSEGSFCPDKYGHAYAVDLVKQINGLNQGKFLYEETNQTLSTSFSIGVAAYPEKHFEAPNLSADIKYLKAKIDAGADYITTQMFFDNQKFFDFVKKCRDAGINVPIIPGLKPITSLSQIKMIPRSFHIDIPEELSDLILNCNSNEEAKEIGIQWGTKQAKELIEYGVPCVHFFSMGKSDSVKQIAKQIF